MIINIVEQLPDNISSRVIANQLVKSGTSVGVNYRAVCRSRSDKEFISKMNIVLEEADEVCFWVEIIQEKAWINSDILLPVIKEANELTAIFVSTLKTINSRISEL